MSPAEIFFRLRRAFQVRAERILYSRYTPRARLAGKGIGPGSITKIEMPKATGDAELLLHKANRLCTGKLDIFALKDIDIAGGIDWHKDYSTGIRTKTVAFSMDINYRDGTAVGDSKYVWEPNRHLFMVTLARAWAQTREEKFLSTFITHLSSWLDGNPFMRGINWSSALELGIRLVNWSVAWQYIADDLPEELRTRWTESIHNHCLTIRGHFSRHSSANNHLIGEATGLFAACCLLPEFRRTRRWRKLSRSILVRETIRQNFSDGVNREQAVWYGMYVLDFLLLGIACGERSGLLFPDRCYETAEAMAIFFLAIRDHGDILPEFGDRDDGMMLDLNQRETGMIDSIAATAGFFCDRPDLVSRPPDTKTQVLLAIANRDFGPAINVGPGSASSAQFASGNSLPVSFPAGGYCILENSSPALEQKLVFDAGPLGYLSIAAHGHADALSFTLSINQTPVFVDRGTGAYFSKPEWRRYFRSTRAHNTVEVDGQDQSVQAGLFMWSRKARTRLIECNSGRRARDFGAIICASHDGYGRLPDPVIHERTIGVDRESGTWILDDRLICGKEHSSALFFHLHPDCAATKNGNVVNVTAPAGINVDSDKPLICRLILPESCEISLHYGEKDSLSGWHSPSYDVKIPAWTIRAECRHMGETVLRTTLKAIRDA